MPVKIRLSRQGKKAYPFYHIVVADSRAPRDGRYIEKLGVYNPNTNPATIEFDFDRALDWLQKGAQPTDTARTILSKKGVLIKKHFLEGVKKGAFTVEVAEQKFESWLNEKESKIQAEKDQLVNASESERKKRLDAEMKVKDARAEALAKKLASEAASKEASAKPAFGESPKAPVASEEAPVASEETSAASEEAPVTSEETSAASEETPAAE